MGKHDLVGIAKFAQLGDIFYIDIGRRDDVQADAIKSNIDAFGKDRLLSSGAIVASANQPG
jgi:hypothetical protein